MAIEWATHTPTGHASAHLPARLVLHAYPSRLTTGEYVAWAHMDGGIVLRDDSLKGGLDQAKERAVELGLQLLRSRQAEITAAFDALDDPTMESVEFPWDARVVEIPLGMPGGGTMTEDFDLIGFLDNEVDRRQGAGEAYHAEAEAALAEAQRWLRRLDALERAEDSLGRVYDVTLIPEAE